MALSFDLKTIIDRLGDAAVYDGDRIRGETECIIFGTMFIGMNSITADNLPTFAARLAAWETAVGPINTRGTPITAAELHRHIGLTPNAKKLTLAQFERALGRAALDTAKREAERAVADVLEAEGQ